MAASGIKTGLITVEWTVDGLANFFGSENESAALSKSKDSSKFDSGRWSLQLTLRPDYSDGLGLFVYGYPTPQEKENGTNWRRDGRYAFVLQILQLDGSPISSERSFAKDNWGRLADSSTRIEGQGWPTMATRKAAFFDNEVVRQEDAFVVRCTISTAPYISSTPLPPPPPRHSESLSRAYEGYFESETAADLAFYFRRDVELGLKRELIANGGFLQNRSQYFKSMLTSGFCEGQSTSTTSSSSKQFRPNDELAKSNSAWRNDDDALEWLPEEWLEEHGPKENEDAKLVEMAEEEVTDSAESDEEVAEAGDAEMESPKRSDKATIEVTDFGYTTYRAMLYFLHTERIVFHPLASNFTVELLKRTASGDTVSLASRRSYLLEQSETRDDAVGPASAHAIYRLADKLDLPDLKKRAKEAIVGGFTVENVLYELISTFAHQFDEMRDAAIKFAMANWDEVKKTPSFSRTLAGASGIEGGTELLGKLLIGLAAPPPPTDKE